MIREIITYPNPRLFLQSQEVKEFDEQLHILLDDMYETMIENKGVGLAAIQVDIPLRALLVDIGDEEGIQKDKQTLLEIINPIITALDDEVISCNEGCLSIPGFYENVMRYKNIRLDYQDRFGKKQSLNAHDFLAVAIQHEVDHLDGHLFIEKLSFLKRKKFDKEFKKKSKKS
ncbi:peptide deformylase [Campylobacter insulaenigrae]|uniref:Peptide deformylase n=1 Tax=Campylobacter insulaenigrae NCTC 12927 TaxID=1031564 RepID=A0A0A8H621_9BACT|nr:peptide deformylase [Campylobacter insulaenigrae]AJC88364.1 peptide deformylase [Campylobacter insulaenigrae NCTC 12927]MCR6572792.1 peptide deformylase [Campylobacter insulaenigrae]MCR6574424.1 peptide deformylase [Campylobacter insulaenigrae]MCR6575777.1 peptide deformylase [Campylobacter insulaenigrae]MCR6577580.1 peptide deformylase [Campylobacter insulaenigrae]